METPRRSPAGRDEVLAATLRGSLTGLLLRKRVSLQANYVVTHPTKPGIRACIRFIPGVKSW